MKKINSIIYNKLLLQAQEAKDRDMVKLANGIFSSIGALPEDEKANYNFNELENDVYQGLWKIASCIIKYHDVKSADAEKIHEALEAVADKLIEEVERSINVNNESIGPLEEKVPGQS